MEIIDRLCWEKCNNKIKQIIKGVSVGSADVMLIHCLETATKCDFWGFPHVLLCQASPPFQLQPQLPSLPKSIFAHQWVYPVSLHTARGLVLHNFCLSLPLFAKVEQNLSVHVSNQAACIRVQVNCVEQEPLVKSQHHETIWWKVQLWLLLPIIVQRAPSNF